MVYNNIHTNFINYVIYFFILSIKNAKLINQLGIRQ